MTPERLIHIKMRNKYEVKPYHLHGYIDELIAYIDALGILGNKESNDEDKQEQP